MAHTSSSGTKKVQRRHRSETTSAPRARAARSPFRRFLSRVMTCLQCCGVPHCGECCSGIGDRPRVGNQFDCQRHGHRCGDVEAIWVRRYPQTHVVIGTGHRYVDTIGEARNVTKVTNWWTLRSIRLLTFTTSEYRRNCRHSSHRSGRASLAVGAPACCRLREDFRRSFNLTPSRLSSQVLIGSATRTCACPIVSALSA